MQRRDNPEMALAAAARDQAEFTRDLRRRLPTFDIPYSDNGFDVSKVTKKSAVFLTIGTRGDLTKQQAKTAAEMFLKIRKRAGPEMVCLRLAGWNDDRRETCDIPEAAKYVRLWGQLVGFDESMSPILLGSRQITFEDLGALSFLNPVSVTLLVACGCFGEAARRAVRYEPKVLEQ